jgi:hypothetical protein
VYLVLEYLAELSTKAERVMGEVEKLIGWQDHIVNLANAASGAIDKPAIGCFSTGNNDDFFGDHALYNEGKALGDQIVDDLVERHQTPKYPILLPVDEGYEIQLGCLEALGATGLHHLSNSDVLRNAGFDARVEEVSDVSDLTDHERNDVPVTSILLPAVRITIVSKD